MISHICITELLSQGVSFFVKIFFSKVGRKIDILIMGMGLQSFLSYGFASLLIHFMPLDYSISKIERKICLWYNA